MSAGQYLDVKIEYTDITEAQFKEKMSSFNSNLEQLFAELKELEAEIKTNLKILKFS